MRHRIIDFSEKEKTAVGLFDKYKKYRENSQTKNFEKCGETLKKIVTTKEQRLEAIEILAHSGQAEAVPHLLKRYEIVVDQSIQDNREKEMVMEAILAHKDLAKPYILEAIKTQKRVSWPIRIAEKMFPHEEYVGLLIDTLHTEFVGFDESIQERNIEILLALRELRDPRIVPKVAPLLDTRDENVRIAVIECLEEQSEHDPVAKQLILNFISQPVTDDTSRFVGLVRTIAKKHNWV